LAPGMTIGFRDHEGFHRAALAMAAAGAAAGVAAHMIGGAPPVLVGGAAGAVLGAGWVEPSRRVARTGLGLALVAIGALVALRGGGLVPLAVATALALHVGAPLRRALIGTAVGTAVLLAAAFAAGRIAGAEETARLPAWLVSGLGAATLAFIAVAARLPRHVFIERDPVEVAIRSLPIGVDGEVRDLIERGRGVWSAVQARLGGDPGSRDLVRDGVLGMVEVGRRSAEVPSDVTASAAGLAERVADLDARIAAATDDVIAAQYREARAALDDQRRYLDAIRTDRERVVARMHNYLAALERFRLAVLNARAADASRLAAEARPLLGAVAELSAELDACGEALDEAAAPAATSAPA